MTALYQSNLNSLELLARGKVRDLYAVDDDHLLIVTTDRLSAFDVVLPDPIPGKGAILTAISNFWFARTEYVVANHLSPRALDDVVPDAAEREPIRDRAIVVRRLQPLPVEAIVRGYLAGSGWSDYQRTGGVCGIALPAGLQQAEQLPEPILTPSSKARRGKHDENITFDAMVDWVGREIATQVQAVSIRLYQTAAAYALKRGIIIADTKFEFGVDSAGDVVLIDELLTPDSSRFWPVGGYRVATNPPNFDKQYIRDYLAALNWNKTAPAPRLPPEVIEKTRARYREAMTALLSQ